jgi:predicted metal-binding protein
MDVRTVLSKALEDEGCLFSDAGIPGICIENVLKNRSICENNRCGCYGVTWSCPPGVCLPEECAPMVASYQSACIMHKVYVRGTEDIEEFGRSFQSLCRKAKHILEDSGFDALVLSDGRCSFCDECSYPGPCRHPGECLPSVSGMGIDMGAYLGSAGMDFVFDDDVITLYGIILAHAHSR